MGIKIEAFTKDSLIEIVPLINNYKNKPFNSYSCLSNEALTNYAVEEISKVLSCSGNNITYTAKDGLRIVGLIVAEKLPWDSEYFGIKMARISYLVSEGSYTSAFDIKNALLNAVFSSCVKEGIKFISAKVNFEDTSSMHSLEERGFRTMSMCGTYLLDKNYYSGKLDQPAEYVCNIRPYKIEDYRSLKDIFNNSCIKSHFRRDELIPQDKVVNLYSEWIKNSCNSSSEEVMVVESRNQIIACATFGVEERFSILAGRKLGRTPLAVFSESARGTGLHNVFVLKLLLEYYFTKVEMVDVTIQIDNIKAAKYWFQLGARMVDCRYVLHKWLL